MFLLPALSVGVNGDCMLWCFSLIWLSMWAIWSAFQTHSAGGLLIFMTKFLTLLQEISEATLFVTVAWKLQILVVYVCVCVYLISVRRV